MNIDQFRAVTKDFQFPGDVIAKVAVLVAILPELIELVERQEHELAILQQAEVQRKSLPRNPATGFMARVAEAIWNENMDGNDPWERHDRMARAATAVIVNTIKSRLGNAVTFSTERLEQILQELPTESETT